MPATPYLLALDASSTIVAATLPDQDLDLTAWVHRARGALNLTEEQ